MFWPRDVVGLCRPPTADGASFSPYTFLLPYDPLCSLRFSFSAYLFSHLSLRLLFSPSLSVQWRGLMPLAVVCNMQKSCSKLNSYYARRQCDTLSGGAPWLKREGGQREVLPRRQLETKAMAFCERKGKRSGRKSSVAGRSRGEQERVNIRSLAPSLSLGLASQVRCALSWRPISPYEFRQPELKGCYAKCTAGAVSVRDGEGGEGLVERQMKERRE